MNQGYRQRRHKSKSQPPGDLYERIGLRFATSRATAELDLLACVFRCPHIGVPIAEQAGVNHHDFAQDDLRLIWLAADIERDKPMAAILTLARRALQHDGFWEPRQPAGNVGHMRWSNETLVQLPYLLPGFDPVLTEAAARRLVELAKREIEAAEHFAIARQILNHVPPRPALYTEAA